MIQLALSAFGLALVILVSPASATGTQIGTPIPALYPEATRFLESIITAHKKQDPMQVVSGLTVPHHLIAADLIARGFIIAAGNNYDRIILLTPDHFRRSRQPFATTRRSFQTAFGLVMTDIRAVERLLSHPALIEESDLFEKEHGLAALIPYVRWFFPRTPIVPLAISISSTQEEWNAMLPVLELLVNDNTLIVQSTDFSHYLPLSEAVQRDQETLNILAAGHVADVAKLRQPQHVDSTGSQYIQIALQRRRFNSRPVVIANTNMQFYTEREEAETTSYVVQIYPSHQALHHVNPATHVDGTVLCFAGDTFFGRHLAALIARPELRDRLLAEINVILNGCPLVLNLEGVTLPEMPTGLGPATLAMPEALTIELLRMLNVVAVSVANNHSRDIGEAARAHMKARLGNAGIVVLDGEVPIDLGPARIAALTDIDNWHAKTRIITDAGLKRLARSDARPPLVVFMHWGREFDSRLSDREAALVDRLRRAAVSLIIGTHPHVASEKIVALAGGEAQLVYSLGNFLFDQPSEQASGAILEVRFFPQGTFFSRLIPIPNFYDRVARTAR